MQALTDLFDSEAPIFKLVRREPSFKFRPKSKEWQLKYDQPLDGEPALALNKIPLAGEPTITGDETIQRVGKVLEGTFFRCAGQHHAERLLEMADSIPSEWEGFFLIFLGTQWRKETGEVCYPVLFHHPTDKWGLNFVRTHKVCGVHERFVTITF